MYKNNHDSITQKLLDNPGASGIDIKSSLAFFMKKQDNGNYFAFEGNLKDASAFELLVKKINHNVETRTDGDIKFINPDSTSVITWSGSKFIYLSNVPGFNMLSYPGWNSGASPSFTSDSLRLFSKELFSLKSGNSIESDEHFSSLIKESGDVHFWMDIGQYYSSIAGNMMSMLKASSLIDGNVLTFTLNFDDGKISMKFKQYYGKEIAAIFDKYDFQSVDESMVNRIASNNVFGVAVSNYPPGLWKDVLKAGGLDGMANAGLGKINYSLDELLKAIKGPMVFAVTDFIIKKVANPMDSSFKTSEHDVKILFAAAVNDKPSFEKLLNNLHIQDSSMLSKVNYKINNDWFAVSNSLPLVDGFLAGSNNNLPFAGKISGQSFGMYVDIQKILKTIQPTLTDSSSHAAMNASLKMWQDVIVTAGAYKNGASSGDMVINLVDKSTNSLKQFNEYAKALYNAHKLKRYPEYSVTDSSAVMIEPQIDSAYSIK
jgi:hypothetical protein